MASWNDLGTTLNTLREIDVGAIREESERPLYVACIGPEETLIEFSDLLTKVGHARYGPAGADPLGHYPLPLRVAEAELSRADMIVLVADGREPLGDEYRAAFEQIDRLTVPMLLVSLYAEGPPHGSQIVSPALATAHIAAIKDPADPRATDEVAGAVLIRLPGELHLSAARRLPGLRAAFARNLLQSTSFANASYSLATGIPEQIPLLAVPFAAADILVLTKNQTLMVYKLALAHGAPPDFQARAAEVLPVIGGAFVWRQLARTLVGLIPLWGLIPKVSIAYAGTYTTGVAAWRWYDSGELVSGARLKQISDEAMRMGRERAVKMIEQARAQGEQAQGGLQSMLSKVRAWLPGQKPPPALNPPPEPTSSAE